MVKLRLSNLKSIARVAKVGLVKHAPEILMGTGTVAFVATVITASRSTIKAQDILADCKEKLDDIKEIQELQISCNGEVENIQELAEYDEKQAKKDRITAYVQMAIKLAKEYAIPFALALVTVFSFFGAFGIMKKRYATLATAYSALSESFRRYRERVIQDKGADKDLEYLTGGKVKELTETDKDGKKVKRKVLTLPDGTELSPYAFKFAKYKENGELNYQWQDDFSLNRAYILGQQDYLNDQLYMRCVFDDKHRVMKRGWVFLNEIRDLLGEDPTSTGAVVGNLFGNGEPGRDGFIDFRLVESRDEDGTCFYINPNVDGLIYDIVENYEKVPFEPVTNVD